MMMNYATQVMYDSPRVKVVCQVCTISLGYERNLEDQLNDPEYCKSIDWCDTHYPCQTSNPATYHMRSFQNIRHTGERYPMMHLNVGISPASEQPTGCTIGDMWIDTKTNQIYVLGDKNDTLTDWYPLESTSNIRTIDTLPASVRQHFDKALLSVKTPNLIHKLSSCKKSWDDLPVMKMRRYDTLPVAEPTQEKVEMITLVFDDYCFGN
jgi:hypothetical protein